ncbi:hypothetical protein BDA99DRAFT_558266 [Phascolomyces articulosus]|uniref:G-patch domain-containing protein n=1 Tax=Phascolomyces articulosus TaxID=60185 RepID=A0AAD5PFQ2_9FUNG|nr:hypothetical protein BDA99DRAFT_558266 [Phascolomyces articulosus]
MENDHSVRKTTHYSRPIEFVRGTAGQKTLSTTTPLRSTGDQVADLYKSIISEKDTMKNIKETNDDDNEKEEKLWCPDCQLKVPASTLEQHLRGIAHRMSSHNDTTTTTDFLALNGSNVGFQLLKSLGWEYEKGLGPEGQGRRHPIATALKQDTHGLGHKNTAKKRITHTAKEIEEQHRQKKPISTTPPKPTGKVMARQERRETRKRMNMLHYLNN